MDEMREKFEGYDPEKHDNWSLHVAEAREIEKRVDVIIDKYYEAAKKYTEELKKSKEGADKEGDKVREKDKNSTRV
jgi:uncharacterized protein YeaO (DUF488 family)